MGKRRMTVILLPTDEGGYQVFFPRFPNCLTEGGTVEEALRNAKEAIELHLEEPTEDDLEGLEFSHVSHVVVAEVEIVVPDRVGVTRNKPTS